MVYYHYNYYYYYYYYYYQPNLKHYTMQRIRMLHGRRLAVQERELW